MKRILLVDDSRLMLKLAQTMLNGQYDVLTAGSAAEAIASAVAYRPDLVLTDLNLQGPDGQQLRAVLGSDARTRGIKVVVVAAESELGRLRDDTDRLAKPFSVQSLLGKVAQCLN